MNHTSPDVRVNSLTYSPGMGWLLTATISDGDTEPHLCLLCAMDELRRQLLNYEPGTAELATYPPCKGYGGITCSLPPIVSRVRGEHYPVALPVNVLSSGGK